MSNIILTARNIPVNHKYANYTLLDRLSYINKKNVTLYTSGFFLCGMAAFLYSQNLFKSPHHFFSPNTRNFCSIISNKEPRISFYNCLNTLAKYDVYRFEGYWGPKTIEIQAHKVIDQLKAVNANKILDKFSSIAKTLGFSYSQLYIT